MINLGKHCRWVILSVLILGILVSPGIIKDAGSEELENWPLWPTSPYLNTVFEKYTVPYPPLAFTIVGQDRDFLAWVITQEQTELPYSWGSVLYLSNLLTGVVSSSEEEDEDTFFTGSNIMKMVNKGDPTSFGTVIHDNFTSFIIPAHDPDWTVVSYDIGGSFGSSMDIANQYMPAEWWTGWFSWASSESPVKGPGNAYVVCDSGHAAPVLNWIDNIWVEEMPGFSAFKTYLSQNIYGSASTKWGDAVLYITTNEGWLHMIRTNTAYDYFQSRFTAMPTPAFQFSPYHYYYYEEYGYFPRLTTLDGFIGIGDIEIDGSIDDGGADNWRRVLFGSTGMGNSLVAKSPVSAEEDIWDKELDAVINSDDVNIFAMSGDYPSIAEGHSFGLYAVTVAEYPDVTPSSPELLWSISNAYWENNGSTEGAIAIDGNMYSREEVVSSTDYSGYLDLKLSLTRPTIGLVESGDNGRIWGEIMVGVDSGDNFNIYHIDANTGKLLYDPILLCHALDYYEGSNIAYWDTDYEAGFPTRLAPIAHNVDDVSGGAATLNLQSRAVLDEVYIHLSNGNLYVWSPQEYVSNDEGPLHLMKMYYQMSLKKTLGINAYSKSQLGAASMQDMDATYMRTSINNGNSTSTYHRFVALVIKDGEGEYDPDTDTETKDDIRLLLVLDITNIRKYVEQNNDVITLDPAALGRGNQTVILPLTTAYEGSDYRYGWQMYLAGADPSTDKYWNQDIAISSPIFYNGRLVLASYEPDNNQSHIYVLPITKENIDYLANTVSPTGETYLKQAADSYALEEGATIITYPGIEFTGGAAIDEQGNVYVGTSDGSVISEDISGLLPPLPGSGSAYEGEGDVLYWKVIE